MKNRKAFTIVELLAVIVILAIILIIAVPQIMNAIKIAKLKSIEGSARLIATNAEEDYYSQKLINKRYNATSIPCSDVAKLSDDYSSCSITYDNSGTATVTLKGASGGKFDKIKCTGTKANINCSEITPLPGYTDAVELLTSKIGTGGLIKDDHDELRYQGETVDNYVTFNDEVAKWRIVGLFNVDGEQRVKLVRKDSIGSFSWDTSESTINNGYGINQWGPSGTYEGADLMRELNGDYLNYNLSANANWYNGSNNSLGSGNFNKNYVLKESAQELIGEATWYTGGVPYNSTVTLADAYAGERGEQGKMCSSGTYCTDNVERTYTWIGKVGLIYPSDYGYASGNSSCAANLVSGNCDTNWMGSYGWTNSPAPYSGNAFYVWRALSALASVNYAYYAYGVRPSVYLISDIQIKGSGTTSDPYVFAE